MMALVHQRLVHRPEALQHARQCVELWQKLAAEDPRDVEAQHSLVKAYTCLSEVHRAARDIAAAREDLLKTLPIAKKLATDPNDLSAQIDLAATYFNLGSSEMQMRHYGEAARWLQQGVTVLQELHQQGKLTDQPRYRELLAQKEQLLAVCQNASRAINDLDFALRQPPVQAAALLTIRATALASRGQHVAAAETADKLLTLDAKNSDNAYNAACMYALCVSSVGQGKPPEQLTPQEATAQKRYATRALDTLLEAVALGYSDLVNIETDSDLDSIQQDDRYRTLIARLKPAARQGDKETRRQGDKEK
jgi:tetratricopeptide (TPR) repeat protein